MNSRPLSERSSFGLRRRWFEGLCQGALHAARGDRPLDRAGDQLTGVLVDDVEDPKRAAISGVAADEVIRPDVVWILRPALPHRVLHAALSVLTRPLLFRLFEPFPAPQPLDPCNRLTSRRSKTPGSVLRASDLREPDHEREWRIGRVQIQLADGTLRAHG
jgi:hypothetical protein